MSRSVLLALCLVACGPAAPRPRPVATARSLAAVAPDPDPDGDGVTGAADGCPDAPEDCDGVDDADGCPDPDDDHDGVADACDVCPREPGAPPDGCEHRVVIESQMIRVTTNVHFAPNEAALRRESAPVIDAVRMVLRDHPQVRQVEVRGHASAGERAPQRLSQRRAEAVLAALVRLQVDPSRLVARGYGVGEPLASNDTADGRARNRRVEFRVIQIDEPSSSPSPRSPRRVVPDGCPDAPPPPPRGPCA